VTPPGLLPCSDGTLELVRRFLLSPRWLFGHALVAAAFVTFLWLGTWQWDRAHAAGGGGQNLGYALQWPLFALFVLFGWWRVLRLEAAKSSAAAERSAPTEPAGAPAPTPTAPPLDPARRRTVVRRYQPPAVDDDADPELAAYNRHLAELHEQDQRRQR